MRPLWGYGVFGEFGVEEFGQFLGYLALLNFLEKRRLEFWLRMFWFSTFAAPNEGYDGLGGFF